MLYKYFPIERAEFLTNRLIRFTQPGDFNDPFELHPSFRKLPRLTDTREVELSGILAPGGSDEEVAVQ